MTDPAAAATAATAPAPTRSPQATAEWLTAQGRHIEAIALCRAAVAAAPGQAGGHVALAQALRVAGQGDEATAHFERAVAAQPLNRAYALMLLLHRGALLHQQGQADLALACFERATAQHPDSADAWAQLGTLQAYTKAPEVAEPSLQRALQLDTTRADVVEAYGRVLQDQGRFEDAAIVFERLLQLEPLRPLTAGRLMHCKMLMADWTALHVLQQRIEADVAGGQAISSEPFGLQGFCAEPALLGRAARAYSTRYFPPAAKPLPAVAVGRGPKIRLGYVAGEFRNQATSVLLTGVLEHHDRSRFEAVAFDNGWSDGSVLRRRIEAAVDVVPIRGLGHLAAAECVRRRRIDVLVNLNGFFGQERTQVFALKPAPIQVNYLGFPGTIGAPYIDYILADEVVIPQAHQGHYAEQVVYLPECYQPNDNKRQVATAPSRRAEVGLPEEAFVFCCLNNVYKIVPAMFDVWMRVLQQVPGSVLQLYSKVPEAQLNLQEHAHARGVDPQRLFFAKPMDHDHHLARLRLADLFLDTLPYNAHTTGSDALWAGLPVLTCLGQAFPGRVGASLLRAVGLPELVTTTLLEYEALAVRLATEPGLLTALRQRLAAKLPSAPLYNTARSTLHLEDAYTHMVQRARDGLPPAGFACVPRP